MDRYDPAGEFLRISERYRQMSDEELLVLVPQSLELTPFAQQALASEVRQRGMKVEVAVGDKPPAPRPFRPPDFLWHGASETASKRFWEERSSEAQSLEMTDSSDDELSSADEDLSGESSSYDEDRKLVNLCTVWSVRDALKLLTILDNAGIPFFMGPEKATGVDEVTSDFFKGVVVQIMQVGMPWVHAPMKNYFPDDDPGAKDRNKELEEIPIRCPKCHSTEVVFECLVGEPPKSEDDAPQKFKWTCDSCGHRWERCSEGIGARQRRENVAGCPILARFVRKGGIPKKSASREVVLCAERTPSSACRQRNSRCKLQE
jgi:DNA-directed RNA polymerase subunit M/transcription elongation factor TFIIS